MQPSHRRPALLPLALGVLLTGAIAVAADDVDRSVPGTGPASNRYAEIVTRFPVLRIPKTTFSAIW